MGNRKFKLSEMIPNAWFYKLKEMGTKTHHPGKNHNPLPPPPQAPPKTEPPFSKPHHHDPLSQSRKSYHFTRDLNPKSSDLLLFPPLDPPRKSSKKRRPTTTKRRPTSFPTSISTTTTKSSSSSSSTSHADETCVVIDVDKKSLLGRKTEDSVSTILRLPPIKTERSKFSDFAEGIGGAVETIDAPIKQKKSSAKNESLSVKVAREDAEPMASSVFKEQGIRPVRRFPTGSPRFRIRINSPRISRRVQVHSSKGSIPRKSISSESLAIVKSSFDPKRDFRDSMVEMIVENNIRASKDLEELLACYLSLNSDEYHDVIIQVFKQIWLDLNNIRRIGDVVA